MLCYQAIGGMPFTLTMLSATPCILPITNQSNSPARVVLPAGAPLVTVDCSSSALDAVALTAHTHRSSLVGILHMLVVEAADRNFEVGVAEAAADTATAIVNVVVADSSGQAVASAGIDSAAAVAVAVAAYAIVVGCDMRLARVAAGHMGLAVAVAVEVVGLVEADIVRMMLLLSDLSKYMIFEAGAWTVAVAAVGEEEHKGAPAAVHSQSSNSLRRCRHWPSQLAEAQKRSCDTAVTAAEAVSMVSVRKERSCRSLDKLADRSGMFCSSFLRACDRSSGPP